VGGIERDRDEPEGRIRESQLGGVDRSLASGTKRTIDFVAKLITEHNDKLDEVDRHIHNTDRNGSNKKNIEPRRTPSDKP
jgi:hypothetical protein